MEVYTLPDGTTVSAFDQFQIGDQKYPPGWLLHAPAADLAAAGITVTTANDPPPAPVTVVSSLDFRALFMDSERTAITQAAESNAALRIFIDDAASAGSLHLADPRVTTGVASLVAAGLITQDRADQILAGVPPAAPSSQP